MPSSNFSARASSYDGSRYVHGSTGRSLLVTLFSTLRPDQQTSQPRTVSCRTLDSVLPMNCVSLLRKKKARIARCDRVLDVVAQLLFVLHVAVELREVWALGHGFQLVFINELVGSH